jgi:hypothetical protein
MGERYKKREDHLSRYALIIHQLSTYKQYMPISHKQSSHSSNMKALTLPLLFISTSSAWLLSGCAGSGIHNWKKDNCYNFESAQVQYQSDNKCTMFVYSAKDCKGNSLATTNQNKCTAAPGGAKVLSVKCKEL